MADKYEIKKISTFDPNILSTVARSDTWEWAKKIADALNICEVSKFSVFFGEDEILSLEDAMRIK